MHLRAAAEPDFPRLVGQSPTAARFPLSVSHHRDERLSNNLYSLASETVAAPANGFSSAGLQTSSVRSPAQRVKALYTPEQRARRDATRWTLVQGILAPVQFAVFLISLALVVRYLASGEGLGVATASIVAKTLLLYAIMITGSIWEREVFGCYLFAPAFFWEDVFSFLVLGFAHRLPGRFARRARQCAAADDDRAGCLRILLRQRHAIRPEAARRAP